MNNYGVTPDVFGSWVFVAACVVTMAGMGFWAWNQSRIALKPKAKKERPPGMRFVTRDEHRQETGDIKNNIGQLARRIDEHERGTRDRSEKVTESLHKIEMRLADTAGQVVTIVDNALKPIENAVGKLREEVAVLTAAKEKSHG